MNLNEIFSPENIALLASNIAVIVFSLVTAYKAFTKKWNEMQKKDSHNIKGEVKRQSEVDIRIMKKLEEVKETLNADRVQIYDFHNGIRYANGRSALKTTCTYETCRYGVKHYQNSLSGIPLSCIPNFISALLNDGEIECKNIEEIRETMPATYSFKKGMQVKSFYDTVFHNEEGEIVGFIAIQFCTNKYNVNKEVVQKLVGYVESELSSLAK